MRLPRDVSGQDLVARLVKYGYVPTRQSGSHIRVTTQKGGVHSVTIPAHVSLRVGTLSSILADVAKHAGVDRDALIAELFG